LTFNSIVDHRVEVVVRGDARNLRTLSIL